MTAIQIQRHYLAMAEANLSQAFMPPWAPIVCMHWGRALDLLQTGGAAGALDWPTKLKLFASHAERRGLNWNRMNFWASVLDRLRPAKQSSPEDETFNLEDAIGPNTMVPGTVKALETMLRKRGLNWDELRRVLALRPELLELDFRFGQLGEGGIFNMLDEAGALNHRVDGVDNFGHAECNPPAAGRASLRGAVVKRVASDTQGQWLCTWSQIYSRKHGRLLDLGHPFQKKEEWYDQPDVQSAFAS
jgi:hypothetical protein